MSLLNKLLPPPLTNPFFRTPGQALDAVIKPIQDQFGIPGSYQFIEQAAGRLLQGKPRVGSIPPMANGESYRRAELRLADAARPGGGGGGGGNAGYSIAGSGVPAAERAYQQEKSRVAQLTAQDPELQRYEAARKLAVAPGATPEQVQSAEDIGMQIWQQKYGGAPMGQPGGAIGVDNPLMKRTFGYQSGSAPDQQIGGYTQGPTPNIPQVDQSLNPASPTFIGGEGGPLMNFADENLTPEMIEAYQKQLLTQAESRK